MTTTRSDIPSSSYSIGRIVLAIALVGGVIPPLLYWNLYGRTKTITPSQAIERLEADSNAVLIDVRTRERFNTAHIEGAFNWPLKELLSATEREDVPEQWRGRELLLLCDVGFSSAVAARHLTHIGVPAANVKAGIQGWIATAAGPQGGSFQRFETGAGQTREFPTRRSPWYEQWAAVISAYGFKPAYTVLSALLAILLWRRTEPDLKALRWSMVLFFLGENCCAINYLLFSDTSYLFEYLHSYGMLLSFSFAIYAVLEGVDRRILMLSDPDKRCAALHLCGRCIKHSPVPCGLRRVFLLVIPALAILALMPLGMDWHTTSYNTMILGTFYNYTHRLVYQQFERLYCPAVAIVFLSMSLLVLVTKKKDPLPLAKLFLAAGVGPLGFGAFRSVLAGMYSQNLVWFHFWEEATELMFILGVCLVLWIFRRSVLLAAPGRPNANLRTE